MKILCRRLLLFVLHFTILHSLARNFRLFFLSKINWALNEVWRWITKSSCGSTVKKKLEHPFTDSLFRFVSNFFSLADDIEKSSFVSFENADFWIIFFYIHLKNIFIKIFHPLFFTEILQFSQRTTPRTSFYVYRWENGSEIFDGCLSGVVDLL